MPSDRHVLKAHLWEGWDALETDQRKGLPPPPLQKPPPRDASRIDLVAPDALTLDTPPLLEVIRRRRSRRTFSQQPLSQAELSFLLWATQGVQEVTGDGVRARRTVPSAGARHPFETYLFVYPDRVTGLGTGLYRYLPLDHALIQVSAEVGLADRVTEACRPGHRWVRNSAVLFIWTAIPYRTEWRYSVIAPKLIALDAGHVCQNLYLASEAIGAGACAIGAYDQARLDAAIGVDGTDEFVVYVAPVGKID
jgi:SagB-type dehydrogenase family enzyme